MAKSDTMDSWRAFCSRSAASDLSKNSLSSYQSKIRCGPLFPKNPLVDKFSY